MPKIVISIVSHSHGKLVKSLLESIVAIQHEQAIEIILTRNVPEQFPFTLEQFPFPIQVIDNTQPKGYGANHNQAFIRTGGDIFCIANPDIYFVTDPFPELIKALQLSNVAIAAPKLLNEDDSVQPSYRKFLTPKTLFNKYFRKQFDYPIIASNEIFYPDWVAGSFMCVNWQDYHHLAGFDENYFLYCEDADICARAWQQGKKVAYTANASVYHVAQQASHRRLKPLWWHIKSLLYFMRKNFKREDSTYV